MDPGELLERHEYARAVDEYSRRLIQKEDALDLANLSTALLCLGRLDEALRGLRRANDLRMHESKGESQPYLKKIAATEWLLGEKGAAIQTLRTAVEGIAGGPIAYTDAAGGVTEGALLWFMGVSTNDPLLKDIALKFLKRLAKKSRIQYWPGPIARYVLGDVRFDEVLNAAGGSRARSHVLAKATSDVLVRRQLCQALFYEAMKQREAGDEEGCLRGMRACYGLENPFIEVEWYLARGEVQAAMRNS